MRTAYVCFVAPLIMEKSHSAEEVFDILNLIVKPLHSFCVYPIK